MRHEQEDRRRRRCQRVRRRRAAAPAARPPRGRDRRADRRQQRRRSRWASLQPHLVPLAERVLEPTDVGDRWPVTTSSSWRCRTASPARSPRRWPRPRRHRGHRLRRRLPAGRPGGVGAVLRRPARRHLALRAARAARPARRSCRGATRIAVPGCYPTVATLTLAPAVAAGPGRARRRRGGGLGHQRRGQGREDQPARQRGDGQRDGVRRRRHAPAHARDHPEPRRARPTAP